MMDNIQLLKYAPKGDDDDDDDNDFHDAMEEFEDDDRA